MELKDFKNLYSELGKKYDLPSFKELNENFEIEKIERHSETLLRAIRKVMMEKILSSLGFVEMLLNPMNAPRMYLSYIRSIGQEDRECIDKIYSSFSEVSVLALDAEIDYSEKTEAELIKKILVTWKKAQPEFRKILTKMKIPSNSKAKKERSYFG